MIENRIRRLAVIAGLGVLLTVSQALGQTVTPDPLSAITGGAVTTPGTPPPAGAGASGAAAPVVALPAPTAPTIPTLTSSAMPSTLPTSAPAAGMNVQFPPAVITANDSVQAPLYGTSLFTGAFAGATITMRPDYVIQVGDIIDVKSYGNLSLDVVARVNQDGKLFLPVVGPIPVAGITRDKLNDTLHGALSAIYTNTRIYADIVQPGAVGVYVTGQVPRPGRYLGAPTDNLLYYLDKAGGIDGQRGSFRDVAVHHAKGGVEHFDLYDFLRRGSIAPTRFADGDVIVIRPRGPLVVVTGLAQNSYAYELATPPEQALTETQSGLIGSVPNGGSQIITLALPNQRLVTDVYVGSVRDRKLVAAYLPYSQFPTTALGDGDHVEFRSDTISPTIMVTLLAKLSVPSMYIVPRDTTLKEVLANIPTQGSNVDPESVYVVRKTVAIQQKQLLDAALLQLQEDAFAATAVTTGAAQIQSSTADLVTKFVAAADSVTPTGQIAIYRDGKFQDIHLQDGDQIVLPEKTDVVIVAGEVLAPGGFARRDHGRIKDYIEDAGGFTIAANQDDFVLRHPNGSARVVDDDAIPAPGDQIMILPKVQGQTFELVKDISTLVFQLALSAATVINIGR